MPPVIKYTEVQHYNDGTTAVNESSKAVIGSRGEKK